MSISHSDKSHAARRPALATLATLGTLAAIATTYAAAAFVNAGDTTVTAPAKPLGDGTVHSYVTFDNSRKPIAVGIALSHGATEKLPTHNNPDSRCFDVNDNGKLEDHECIGDYETVLEIPQHAADMGVIPFRWIGVNWNPHGHMPPAPPGYADPHFDFHFYTADRDLIESIRPGSCGELVDCDDFKAGSVPVHPDYLPQGHIDVGAVVARMGNHLLDSNSPELQNPPARFTRTFIYGSYNGELIFWEPMITLDYLTRTTDECAPVNVPKKVRTTGYYPAKYCIRLNSATNTRTVSLEGLVLITAN